MSPNPFPNLIAAIYRTVLEPTEWRNVLDSIAALFDGHATFTIIVNAIPSGLFCYNLPIESFVLYDKYYYRYNLWVPPWTSRGLHMLKNVYASGQVVNAPSVGGGKCGSVQFNEFLRPLDTGHSIFAALSNGTDRSLVLAIDRPICAEPFSESAREKLKPIVEHLSQAMRIWQQFQQVNENVIAHEQTLETLKRGVLSINLKGKVLYANGLATAILAQQNGLTVKNGVLCASTNEGNRALTHLLALANQGIEQSCRLARRPPSSPLKIQSVPLTTDHLSAQYLSLEGMGKIILIITEETSLQANDYQQFAKAHQLTRQETKVLQQIIEGYALKEIASHYRVSINTVRSQVSSLMQKTGCHCQKDVMRLFFDEYSRSR